MRGIVLLIALCLIATSAYAASTEGVMNDVWDSTNSRLNVNAISATATDLNATVDVNPGSSVVAFTKAVTAGGAPTQLSSDSIAVISVTVRGTPLNQGTVWIGGSTVTADRGCVVSRDNSVTLNVDNVNDLYICSDVNTDKVGWIGIVK